MKLTKTENCRSFTRQLRDRPNVKGEILVQNVVGTAFLGREIPLRKLALVMKNVEYRPENRIGLLIRLRHPQYITGTIFSTGSITVMGAISEENCRLAARSIARQVQLAFAKLSISDKNNIINQNQYIRFLNFRITAVSGSTDIGYNIDLRNLAKWKSSSATFEPEIISGVTYKVEQPRCTFEIFSSGKIISLGAASVNDTNIAFKTKLLPILKQFQMNQANKTNNNNSSVNVDDFQSEKDSFLSDNDNSS